VTKRLSWVDTFVDREDGPPLKKEHLFVVDDILHGLWSLGRNIILLWTPRRAGMTVLIVPHYLIASAGVDGADGGSANIATLLQSVLAGPKMVAPDRLEELARLLNCRLEHIELPFTPGEGLPFKAIDSVLKRYCVTFVGDRAVVLFDAVGFSLFSPLEQVAQLNSLAYSVNSAYSKLLDQNIEISFARITTGDGFYIWNRRCSVQASIDMYHFMHLVMADNAIARGKTVGNTTPHLRTCFHVGSHYEFYQSEGLSPTTFSYIVGDVTIELARMIEAARAGQILVGDFRVQEIDAEIDEPVVVDTVSLIDRAQETLANLNGLVLSGDCIESIKCYLTGAKQANGDYSIRRYRISDKHGLARYVYNAKVNIYRSHADPIYLGVQDAELADFGASEPNVFD
jgi:hypothetical protein